MADGIGHVWRLLGRLHSLNSCNHNTWETSLNASRDPVSSRPQRMHGLGNPNVVRIWCTRGTRTTCRFAKAIGPSPRHLRHSPSRREGVGNWLGLSQVATEIL